jgi:nucleotide-binding universal stress UspA family protein
MWPVWHHHGAMAGIELDASKHVVAAVDTSERSLDGLAVARLLANAVGAFIDVVSVFPYLPLADPSREELAGLREEATAILRELAERSGVDAATVQVIPGNAPARELQRVSENDATGAIVVGSTHRGAVGRVLPGSVGERLLAGSASPVAIAPRDYWERPAARLDLIGVGFDGSDEARRALEFSRALARTAGARMRILSVFQRVAFGAVATGRTGGASVNELVRSELRSAFDDALSDSPGSPASEGRFLEGPAAELLTAESAELDVLVTGSRTYGPRAAVLLGGTTHALMQTAACPALIVPRGAA